ncbi:hypothetical protein B857_01556 [Solibacillus isronensis B3W22]|uniref:BCR, YitT family n=1 Tax=Solibacillus isronensis B3W22 TaxID=1224748 RepID=K1KNA7_9BACL|nr:DUF6198 family protein [Solibacillus isronensis]AMO86704.1 hypothetical protein SOLI23_14350 [Solibacillus silvestris]EKB45605.1 hypothetical protein B857_01556 [Solibacillus isronensis B3W22]
MNHTIIISKRISIYIIGLFLLSLGATFSILAGIGVSPVTSLPYALALTTPLSVGITTVLANFVFIILQAIILKEIRWKNFFIQLIISFLFGFFMDFTIWLTNGLPEATSLVLIIVYLAISLILVALALLLYFTANLPTMPYDSLTYVIANTWKIPFSKAKITSDMLNVVLSLVICLLFIQSFGAIGIGTFIAAYGIGKMVGVLLHKLQPSLKQWVYKNN